MANIKKKAVVKIVVNDAKSKKAAMKAIVEIDGFTSFTIDFRKSTLVVIGDTNPTKLVNKLSKFVKADLDTYGPVKDEGKPQNPVIVQNMAVVKLVVNDAESQKAAKKALLEIDGFTSLTLDFEKSTLVVIGGTDPTLLVKKLRKFVTADLHKFLPQKDEGKSQRNDGRGGNVGQQPPQKQQWWWRQPQNQHRGSIVSMLMFPHMFKEGQSRIVK